jgi:hypothetical protein
LSARLLDQESEFIFFFSQSFLKYFSITSRNATSANAMKKELASSAPTAIAKLQPPNQNKIYLKIKTNKMFFQSI